MITAAFLAGLTVGASLMFGGLLLYARMVGESASPQPHYLEDEVRAAIHTEAYGDWPHLPKDGSRGVLK